MSIDIKKIYIDTRYKTEDSKSDTDFFIELPRSFNVPENCVCYIDDFVIPISWPTVDTRNNKLYINLQQNEILPQGPTVTTYYVKIELPVKNYRGDTFAFELAKALNDAITPITTVSCDFVAVFDVVDNEITFNQSSRFSTAKITIVSDADLLAGRLWSHPIPDYDIQSINGMLRIGKYSYQLRADFPWKSYLDLHTTRNLYLTSSALASYSNISNFGNDVIIKKIPVTASFGNMLFHNATTAYDFLDVSKRQLNRIDFRLQDSFGNIVNLRNNHWSFSLVFSERR